jgi:para-aminobenzoate synthetase component 1
MTKSQSLPWCDPLDLASGLAQPYWVLLYSGVQASYSGRYSYLAFDLAERIEGNDFSALAKKLSDDTAPLDNSWFGYLGYGLKNSLERLTPDTRNWLSLPQLWMMRFHTICHFDHKEKTLSLWSDSPAPRLPTLKPAVSLPAVKSLGSNMSREEYLEKAAEIIERIHAGDLYQANLTRKFTGEFSSQPDAFALFRKLCAVSPAPYSAFLQLGDVQLLSSSPELFLRVDKDGHMETRPIKGTAPRFADATLDKKSREALAASGKDRAENLMIVDLMRNDLSRSCVPGSVKTERLFDITTHATIHHMSSSISGQKRPECSTLDVVKHCFPPGSMTGAPKIRAMNLCSEMERLERGVYSGAIGWFGGDGSCELSVVIRTLLLKGKQFEFQVGGGIVADSTPEQEWQEIIDKSKGILAALGVSMRYFGL